MERVAWARLQRALPPSRPYTTTCVSSYCILLCTATYYNICVLTLNISAYYLHSATYIVEQVVCARLERALPCSSPCFPRFPILSVAPGAVYEWHAFLLYFLVAILYFCCNFCCNTLLFNNFLEILYSSFLSTASVCRLRVYFSRHQNQFLAYLSTHQHTSAYISIRQHTSAYVSIRQHTSAYVSIRQHTSAYVR